MTDPLNLDGLEQATLEDARKELAPSPADRRRILQALGISIPGGFPATNLDPEAHAPGSSVASGSGAGFSGSILAGGMIAGALMGFGSGFWVGTSSPSTESPVVSVSDLSSRTKKSAHPPLQELNSSVSLAELSERAAEVERPSSLPKPLNPSLPTNELHAADGAVEGEAEPTFYQELSYVRRAQAALKRGEGALALGLMQSLDEIRSRGALNAERNVTKVLALCQLDRVEEARSLARQALKSDGATDIYRRRLAASCAQAEKEPRGESNQDLVEKPKSQ